MDCEKKNGNALDKMSLHVNCGMITHKESKVIRHTDDAEFLAGEIVGYFLNNECENITNDFFWKFNETDYRILNGRMNKSMGIFRRLPKIIHRNAIKP